jgi:hypothetical protein
MEGWLSAEAEPASLDLAMVACSSVEVEGVSADEEEDEDEEAA